MALGYFGTLDTEANGAFKERYHGRFGERAPPLNSIGQSVYEGMHFLAALLEHHEATRRKTWHDAARPLLYPSARAGARAGRAIGAAPMYLARAEGHLFRVIAQL